MASAAAALPTRTNLDSLREACLDQDAEDASLVLNLVRVAAVIVGLALTLFIEMPFGLLLGIASYCILGHGILSLYHRYRNRPFYEAAKDIKRHPDSFQKYITSHRLTPAIDNIAQIHKDFLADAVEKVKKDL